MRCVMLELLKKYRGIIAYIVFGILTTVINVIVYYICYEIFGIINIISTIIAWFAAIVFAFVTNKKYVFDSKSWDKEIVLNEGIKFLSCRVGTGIIEVIMMICFVDILQVNGTLMKAITNIIVIIINYIFSRCVIFKKGTNSK